MNEPNHPANNESMRLRSNLNSPARIAPLYHSRQIQTANSQKITRPLVLSNVKIQLYKGNELRKTIVENTASSGSSGSYQWQEVDLSLPDGTDYKIRVLSATDLNVYGESDSFEIGDDLDENFENDTNVKNYWKTTNFPHLWTVTNGVYKMIGKGQNQRTASYYSIGDYADFTLQAKCGKETTTGLWYGIAFRGNENFSSYCIFYVGEGKYQIIKYENGRDNRLTDQIGHSAINTGTNHWNTLKVEANGKTFSFYVNGTLVHSRTISDALTNGRIGLVTRANYDNVKFDDVSVQEIR
jgi:hypothetical protein